MRKTKSLLTIAAMGMLGACSTMTPGAQADSTPIGETVSAAVIDTTGKQTGTVELRETSGGVLVVAQVSGVPEGEHGFHFHEKGTCDPAQKFTTAGGHFSPKENAHGLMVENGPHVGDMPNQSADASGKMMTEVLNTRISLQQGTMGSIWDADGTALVIHAKPDDYRSQPSGAAGDRIACAVVASPM